MKTSLRKVYDLGIKIIQDFDFLRVFDYVITDVNFQKLHTPTLAWAPGPYAEVIYANCKNRWVTVDLYETGVMCVEIEGVAADEIFSYEDFMMYRYETKPASVYAKEKSKEGYVDFYIKLVRRSFEGELKEVILGNMWIDVPFDWQGHK
jgi:hypothetical protein